MPAGATREQAPEMLQTLLATRFHLQFRRETKETPVYAIVAGKDGPKLRSSTAPNQKAQGSAYGDGGGGRVRAMNMTMPGFADLMTKVCDRPVIDGTALPGGFDFDLRFAPDLPAGDVPALPTRAEALESLGLKLERRSVRLEFLVLQQADRVPVEN